MSTPVDEAVAPVAEPPARNLPRWVVAVVPGAALVALAAMALAALASGAFGPRAVADPGAVVRWATPLVTTLGHLAAAVTVGALVAVVTLLPRALPPDSHRAARHPGPVGVSRHVRTSLTLAGGAGATWALLSFTRLVLDYASIVGASPADPSFGEQIGVFALGIPLGRMLLAVAVLAAVTSTLALAVRTPTGAIGTLAVAGVALAVLAQTGHGAGSAHHGLAVTAMFLHLAGAALWIGPLAVLALLAARLGDDLAPAVARFSALAIWAFVAVAASGLVNAWIRMGGTGAWDTPYGRLVVGKAVLLLTLGIAGALHRRWTLPQIGTRRLPFWRLVAVELAVMGAASGLAVALAATPPPLPQEIVGTLTPVEAVTGLPAPPEPTSQVWLTQWRPDVLFALVALVMLVTYMRWVWRLRRRGDAWSPARTASWVVGALLFAWVTNGAPAVYGMVLFSVHMVEHMALATLVPVFLALGAPVTLALRALPVRTDRSRGSREWLLALVDSRWARFFAHPLVAAANFAASMVVFYYTPLIDLALTSHVGHIAMVTHFTLVGYLFVNALVGIDPGPRRPPHAIRLLLLFATMAFHAFFGVTLAQSTTLLAADWFGALGLPWGVDALADQQRGANLAWALGELPTVGLAIAVAVQWAREDERAARRRDRAADRDADAELDAYNAMLARLADQDREQDSRRA